MAHVTSVDLSIGKSSARRTPLVIHVLFAVSLQSFHLQMVLTRSRRQKCKSDPVFAPLASVDSLPWE
jgi:hypothetical protein